MIYLTCNNSSENQQYPGEIIGKKFAQHSIFAIHVKNESTVARRKVFLALGLKIRRGDLDPWGGEAPQFKAARENLKGVPG